MGEARCLTGLFSFGAEAREKPEIVAVSTGTKTPIARESVVENPIHEWTRDELLLKQRGDPLGPDSCRDNSARCVEERTLRLAQHRGRGHFGAWFKATLIALYHLS